MFFKVYLTIFMVTSAFSQGPDLEKVSYFDQLKLAFTTGLVDRIVDNFGDGIFDDNEPADYKYNHFHQHKFATPLLLEKCIKFHDSEIVSVDLSKLNGRWDRHLISIPFPLEYEYGIMEYDPKTKILNFKYEPWGYVSHKFLRKGTNILQSDFVVNSFFGAKLLIDEAMIGTDYTTYFMKYSCGEAFGRVSGQLHLQLSPETTAQLDSNPGIFAQILDNIPDKTINKIAHLVLKLDHQKDERFEDFGQTYEKTLTQRLEKYRKDNQLSDKSDDNVFEFLDQNCLNFTEEELKPFDLPTMKSSNWKLDYTDVSKEKLVFNQVTFTRRSQNTSAVNLYNGETHIGDSDMYFDQNRRTFFSYTEGRRSLEIFLVSTAENILVYSCQERQIDGKLQIMELLRYFSHESNSKATDVWPLDSVLNSIKPNLQSKNLQKLEELLKNMGPLQQQQEQKVAKHEDL